MTSQQREYLRQQVDQAKRRTLHKHHMSRAGYCVGCGTDLLNQTQGCGPCWDRARRRRNRDKQLEQDIRIARRRMKLCTRCGRPTSDPEPVAKSECATCWERQRGQRRQRTNKGSSGGVD